MQTVRIKRSLAGLALALGAAGAHAAGFQLLEQNASGIGNAYAGSAAVADNASIIFFNPAGMTRLQPREFSGGLSPVRPSFKFHDQGSVGGVFSGNGGDAGGWALLPNAYLAWALTKDVYAGIGLSAPFGLLTEYDDDWVGAAQAIKFEVRTININPSLAWRVTDKLSVGAGVSWQRLDVEYRRAAAIVPGLATTFATLDADSDAWGWNLGLLYAPTDTTRIGLSYRSRVEHELRGDLKVSGTLAGLNPALTSGAARVDVELPDTWILSVVQQIDPRWEMLGDISWTGWSSIPKVDIMRASGPLSGVTVQTLDADFRDTWRAALGANYFLNDAWKLKFGVAWDQTPVRDPSTRQVSLPDSNRTWLSTGAQWLPDKASRVDLGVAYLIVPESKIDNNQLGLGRGIVAGRYDASVWILGLQYSRAF